MVDNGREATDVLTQVNAATAGLRAVARESLRRHVRQRLEELDPEANSRLGSVVEELLDDYHRQLR